MNKLLLYFQLFHNMGIKYFLFRIQYEIRRKGGMLKRAYPISWEDKDIVIGGLEKARKTLFRFQVERA